MKRVLYMAYVAPPIIRGPSVIINRLFGYFPEDSYMVLTHRFQDNTYETDEGLRLPCSYYYTQNMFSLRFFLRFQGTWSNWLEVPMIFIRGLRVLRDESVSHILVAPNFGYFLLAACLLHGITRIPMSIYFFDIFDNERRDNLEDRMYSLIERLAIKMASNVFVMSEPLRDHYHHKYGIKPILLPHSIDLSTYRLTNHKAPKKEERFNYVLKIVFTGMIYELQLDAILNLVNVVNGLSNVELHIYSPLTEAKRNWMGITGDHVIFHGRVSHKEIPAIQQNADILFLPMAFNSVYPHMIEKIPSKKLQEDLAGGRQVVKTASPSKLPEYLIAGRPILIHAPPYSYVAWYGKTHQCAEVVDTPDLEALRNAVLRLRNDKSYCDLLVANARRVAEQHDAAKVSEMLQQYLGIIPPKPKI